MKTVNGSFGVVHKSFETLNIPPLTTESNVQCFYLQGFPEMLFKNGKWRQSKLSRATQQKSWAKKIIRQVNPHLRCRQQGFEPCNLVPSVLEVIIILIA